MILSDKRVDTRVHACESTKKSIRKWSGKGIKNDEVTFVPNHYFMRKLNLYSQVIPNKRVFVRFLATWHCNVSFLLRYSMLHLIFS